MRSVRVQLQLNKSGLLRAFPDEYTWVNLPNDTLWWRDADTLLPWREEVDVNQPEYTVEKAKNMHRRGSYRLGTE